jgi:hypothetical protein
MDKAIAYFAPEAIGSPYDYFTDGRYYYQRIQGFGALGGLDGWLKRVFKKAKKAVRKVGRKVRKVAKKGFRVAKKVAKKGFKLAKKGLKTYGKLMKKTAKTWVKVIHKALPVVNTALSFVPGVGWVAKAALTAAEMGLNAAMRAKKRRAQRKQMAKLNKAKTTLVTKVNKANRLKAINPVAARKTAVPVQSISQPPVRRAPVYTMNDFIKINKAVAKDRMSPAQVAAITKHKVDQNLQSILSF